MKLAFVASIASIVIESSALKLISRPGLTPENQSRISIATHYCLTCKRRSSGVESATSTWTRQTYTENTTKSSRKRFKE